MHSHRFRDTALLKTIRIHNLAVVEDVELSLDAGLNVLTGSTGAGKSLILGAVNLLLGKKATAGSIRAGRERAVVECDFDLEAGISGRGGLPATPDGRLHLRREVRSNGRSYAFINGETVPVRQLQQVCSVLVEPHGQNEQFRLKAPENHVGYVDALARNGDLAEEYAAALRDYKRSKSDLESFDERVAMLKEKQELLQHRVEEIDRAGITAGELDELEAKIRLLENSEKIFEVLNTVYAALESEDSGAAHGVSSSVRRLSGIERLDEKLGEITSQLRGAAITLDDCAESVRSYIDNIEFDPERLQSLRERRAYLMELERRYGKGLEDIITARGRWAAELETVAFETEERHKLEKKLASCKKGLEDTAVKLSASRTTAAKQLDREMNEELKDLMMSGARFRTHITARKNIDDALPDGMDEVRFLIRPNRGEKEGWVDEIASTGEVSRIVLALKKITNMGRPGSVLIFDELDAGVGADLGGVISEKLLDLSARYQIICITHLPQIAAKGKRHLVVSKFSSKDRTYAQVTRVEGEDRKNEIARMLGGEKGSDNRTALASEMLEKARKSGKSNKVRPHP